MNRGDLEAKICARTNIAPKIVADVLDAAYLEIIACLSRGERVSQTGFGSFTLRQRPDRAMYIPTKGTVTSVRGRRRVVFQPGKQLTRALAPDAAEP